MYDRRGWVPAEWMDEMPPTQGEHPNDFLERRGDTIVLRPIKLVPGEIEGEDLPAAQVLADGQIVGFMWHEDRGSQVLTIRGASDWSIDAPFPEDTNLFRADDEEDDIWDNLGDLVRQFIERAEVDLPATINVDGWVWSDTEWFRLRALESGAARFEPHPSIGVERATRLIQAERTRQIEAEGFSPEHDDAHADGELLSAAVFYLRHDWGGTSIDAASGVPVGWPWEPQWWKPKDQRSNLIRAGALCLAERDRRSRAALHLGPAEEKLKLAVRDLAGLPE